MYSITNFNTKINDQVIQLLYNKFNFKLKVITDYILLLYKR